MANSIAYVLSVNTYPDAFQANLIGVKQGTQIVYATTNTLSSSNILYTDSKMTQPFYGDPTAWYGVQLLTNSSTKYALLISANGAITTNPGTTTTTAGPTTTTTAAPTTTTTTVASFLVISNPGTTVEDACGSVNPDLILYANTPTLNTGVSLFMDEALSVPYNRPLYGIYVKTYFAANFQVCTMGGAFGNTIQSYTAC